MNVERSDFIEATQRIRVQPDMLRGVKRAKIWVETYDDHLGWYTTGSVTIPLHQLPLLEQAVALMRSQAIATDSESAKIIPFSTRV